MNPLLYYREYKMIFWNINIESYLCHYSDDTENKTNPNCVFISDSPGTLKLRKNPDMNVQLLQEKHKHIKQEQL